MIEFIKNQQNPDYVAATVGQWFIEADVETGAVAVTYVPTGVWKNDLYTILIEDGDVSEIAAGSQHAILNSFTWGYEWNTEKIDEDENPEDYEMHEREAARRLHESLENAFETFVYELSGHLASVIA